MTKTKFTSALFLLLLFAYSIVIFFARGWALFAFLFVNILAMLFWRTRVKTALRALLNLCPFVALVGFCNFFFASPLDAFYVCARLILICHITQCFRASLGALAISEAVEALCAPFEKFGANRRDAGLIVSISLAFLPVLRRDFRNINTALRAKGAKFSAHSAAYFLKPFFYNVFRRAAEISLAVRAKGYHSPPN